MKDWTDESYHYCNIYNKNIFYSINSHSVLEVHYYFEVLEVFRIYVAMKSSCHGCLKINTR